MSESTTVPPPHMDIDCHRPPRLRDYANGFLVTQRVIGAPSQWRAIFSDEAEALIEVRHCLDLRRSNGERMYIEVSLWRNGRPIEIWKNGKPMMGSGVAA